MFNDKVRFSVYLFVLKQKKYAILISKGKIREQKRIIFKFRKKGREINKYYEKKLTKNPNENEIKKNRKNDFLREIKPSFDFFFLCIST